MSALDDYLLHCDEADLYGKSYSVSRVQADTAIESLKCCGNCAHFDTANRDFPDADHYDYCNTTEERSRERVEPDGRDRCHFTPSRWEVRR